MSIDSIIEKRVMKSNTYNSIMSIESIIEKRVKKSSTHNLIMGTGPISLFQKGTSVLYMESKPMYFLLEG